MWPVLVALTALPSLIAGIILPFQPDSPRSLYLTENRKLKSESRNSHEGDNRIDPELRKKVKDRFEKFWIDPKDQNVQAIPSEQERKKKEVYAENNSFPELLRMKEHRFNVFMTCMINLCQQLSGINIVSTFYIGGE